MQEHTACQIAPIRALLIKKLEVFRQKTSEYNFAARSILQSSAGMACQKCPMPAGSQDLNRNWVQTL